MIETPSNSTVSLCAPTLAFSILTSLLLTMKGAQFIAILQRGCPQACSHAWFISTLIMGFGSTDHICLVANITEPADFGFSNSDIFPPAQARTCYARVNMQISIFRPQHSGNFRSYVRSYMVIYKATTVSLPEIILPTKPRIWIAYLLSRVVVNLLMRGISFRKPWTSPSISQIHVKSHEMIY